jgi:two-component system cell cycle sensor histidine kinase/response regulator CckA
MDDTPGTVLVVDDDASVRRLVSRVLTRRGFRVVEAEDGSAGLRLARSAPQPIVLLLTDVIMPGMTGTRLAEAMRAEHPDVRVLYMSGYSEDELGSRGAPEVAGACITKPFTPAVLGMMVDGALEA